MSLIEELPIYKELLDECQKYHPHIMGLTTYEGAQNSDKIYPKILNYHTLMLSKIYEKLFHLDKEIKNLKESQNQLITKTDLRTGKEIVPYIPKFSYKSW